MARGDGSQHFRQGEADEARRIRFLESARGAADAATFARQTLGIYRAAVVHRSPPAVDPAHRFRLMGSYCWLKRYLRSTGNPGSLSG